jgi:hypothetical protein
MSRIQRVAAMLGAVPVTSDLVAGSVTLLDSENANNAGSWAAATVAATPGSLLVAFVVGTAAIPSADPAEGTLGGLWTRVATADGSAGFGHSVAVYLNNTHDGSGSSTFTAANDCGGVLLEVDPTLDLAADVVAQSKTIGVASSTTDMDFTFDSPPDGPVLYFINTESPTTHEHTPGTELYDDGSWFGLTAGWANAQQVVGTNAAVARRYQGIAIELAAA